MKKNKIIILIITIVAISIMLVGCTPADKKYYDTVASYNFWENKGTQAVPQTAVYNMIDEHINDQNGKTKKVALLGYDGMRADSLATIRSTGILDDNGTDIIHGVNDNLQESGVNYILDNGGKAYLSYCGGEKGKSSKQYTSTAPGWAAILTGVWGETSGVKNNGDRVKPESKTILLKYAQEKNIRSSFISRWNTHFDDTYLNEVEFVKANRNVPLQFVKTKTDKEIFDTVISNVTVGDPQEKDIVFCIFEAPDYNGHYTGFSNKNNHYVTSVIASDQYVYDVIKEIESRSTYEQEDWLIILTTDHGGINKGHGGQSLEERTTFIITNKTVSSKYFSTKYNGYSN